jgi:hypothetical protein
VSTATSGLSVHQRWARLRLARCAAHSLALVLAAIMLNPFPAHAQDEGIGILVLPETVTLRPGEPVPFQIIVENHSQDDLQNLKLTSFPGDGLRVAPAWTVVRTLSAGDAHVFRGEVEQSGPGELPGRITFRVRYRRMAEAGTTRRFNSASLEVKAAASETASQVAKVEVRTTLASLSENRPGRLYLLITNTANVDIQVIRVITRRPRFIHLIRHEEGSITVSPGNTRTVRFDVTAGNRLQPGKQLLVFEVRLRWTRGDEVSEVDVVASHEVSVEVFGESAILGLIAVPALLLLPGALIVLTVAFGLKVLWKKDALPADVKSTQFWLIAVPLSFVMAGVYPLLPWGQNYLLAYGFKDLVLIWVSSSTLGGLAFLIWWGAGETWRRLTLPKETDSPLKVLKKLGRRGSRVYRARVTVVPNGQPAPAPAKAAQPSPAPAKAAQPSPAPATAAQPTPAPAKAAQEVRGFLLQRKATSGVGQWVGPRILLHFAPQSALREDFERHLSRAGRVKDVVRLVKRGGTEVVLRFDPNSPLRRPHLVSKVTPAGHEDLLIVPRTGFPE